MFLFSIHLYLYLDKNSVIHLFKDQISSLTIDITKDEAKISTEDVSPFIFTQIFTIFTNLRRLNFGPSFIYYQRLSFHRSSPIVFSLITRKDIYISLTTSKVVISSAIMLIMCIILLESTDRNYIFH